VPAVSILAIKISLFFFFLFKKNTLIAVALAVFSGSEVNEVLYKIQSMLDAALAGFSSVAADLAVFSGSEVDEVLYKIQSMLDAALAGFSSVAADLAVFSGSEVDEVLYKIQSMLDAALAGFSSETYHTKKITKLLWHLLILSWQPQTTFTKNWMKLRRKKLLDIPHRLLHETGGI